MNIAASKPGVEQNDILIQAAENRSLDLVMDCIREGAHKGLSQKQAELILTKVVDNFSVQFRSVSIFRDLVKYKFPMAQSHLALERAITNRDWDLVHEICGAFSDPHKGFVVGLPLMTKLHFFRLVGQQEETRWYMSDVSVSIAVGIISYSNDNLIPQPFVCLQIILLYTRVLKWKWKAVLHLRQFRQLREKVLSMAEDYLKSIPFQRAKTEAGVASFEAKSDGDLALKLVLVKNGWLEENVLGAVQL